MEKFKIGYFADGPWSHTAFELLVNDESLEVCFIVPRTDTKDKALLGYSDQYNIPYIENVKVNSTEFYELAKSYKCDLFVSMSFNQIFRPKITNLPLHGTINCHAGKLPFYRGRNILNWALINDEPEFGITVHYVDEGIDTGDIILQRVYPIKEDDNYATLLKRSYVECANILYDAIKMIQTDNSNRIIQNSIHPTGFYCGIRGVGDEIIDWNQSSRDVFNFIRAICEPGPKATTFLHGAQVTINKARYVENVPSYIGKPGQILSKTETGFLVKTKDTFIEILEIGTATKLKVGDRFN